MSHVANTPTRAVDASEETVVLVESMEVSCDGGGGALGHPKVYLHLDLESHTIVCPYCSKTFMLKAGVTPGGGH